MAESTVTVQIQVCSKLSEKFGKHGLVKTKPTVRSLLAPLRMNEGMDEKVAPKKKPEPVDGPLLTERNKMKIERRKRKDERQREEEYNRRVAEMSQPLPDDSVPANVMFEQFMNGSTSTPPS